MIKTTVLFIAVLLFSSCNASDEKKITTSSVSTASIKSVQASGSEGAYTFSVKIESFDSGCDSFANWWEVLREDGSLVYRRILFHSHVNEQPFTRSGGNVKISKNEVVYIRAHMNVNGYGPNQYKGSVENGFSEVKNSILFDNKIEKLSPQPSGCAF